MKKQIVIILLASTLLTSVTEILATAQSVETSGIEYRVAEDVFIDGLYENAVLYTGADIRIKGYVDQGATQKEIVWQLTGNNGMIDFDASGNYAKITGKAQGKLWVMARATDGSDRAREYTVNVQDYPQDAISQSLIGKNITPILKRPLQQNEFILQVEVNKNLSSAQERGTALEAYMNHLAGLGNLSNKGMHADEDYEYYRLDVNGTKVEVRVGKKDVAYTTLKKILSNASDYNHGKAPIDQGASPSGEEITKPSGEEGEVQVKEDATKPPSGEDKQQVEEGAIKAPSEAHEKPLPKENESATETEVSKDEVIGDDENMVILGGTGTSVEDPIIITFKEGLSSQEKLATLERYLMEFEKREGFRFIRKTDGVDFASYLFNISEKNDFFIEIRVKKEDEETYIPIIEMLDEVEKKTLMGITQENRVEKENIDEQEDVVDKNKAGQDDNKQDRKGDNKVNGGMIFLVLGGAFVMKKLLYYIRL